MTSEAKAIVLLSGGVDSALCLKMAVDKYGSENILAISYDYNQPNNFEEGDCVWKLSEYYGVKLLPIELLLPDPRNDTDALLPGRNLIFLSIAMSWAWKMKAKEIWFGANIDDFNNYPDCRPNFFSKLYDMALGFDMDIEIVTPIINFSKSTVYRMAMEFEVPVDLTWSCYNRGPKPCGKCDSCKLLKKAKAEYKA